MLVLKDLNLLRQACYIDGAWVGADSGEFIDVTNPATGEVVATVPRCGAAETERAIAAAETALKTWRETTAAERSRILRRWFDLLMTHQDDLAGPEGDLRPTAQFEELVGVVAHPQRRHPGHRKRAGDGQPTRLDVVQPVPPALRLEQHRKRRILGGLDGSDRIHDHDHVERFHGGRALSRGGPACYQRPRGARLAPCRGA